MKDLSKLRHKYSFVLPSLPDERDYLYAAGHISPNQYSLREFRGKIWDQGRWGSCTGHGTVGMLHSFYKRVTGLEIDFNPYWIWYWGRKRNNTHTMNVGAYVRDIFDNLVKIGICENSMWHPCNYDESPPRIKNRDIIKFKGYKRFKFTGDFEQLKNDFFYCIGEEKLPIGVTIAVHKSFETYTAKTGEVIVPSADDPILGYHWLYIDEINNDGAILVNSWGKKWGNQGECFMPWEYVSKYVVEAWSLDPELP